jgi:hypothetical protein
VLETIRLARHCEARLLSLPRRECSPFSSHPPAGAARANVGCTLAPAGRGSGRSSPLLSRSSQSAAFVEICPQAETCSTPCMVKAAHEQNERTSTNACASRVIRTSREPTGIEMETGANPKHAPNLIFCEKLSRIGTPQAPVIVDARSPDARLPVGSFDRRLRRGRRPKPWRRGRGSRARDVH